MTQEQQTIINNLIDEFNKVNNGTKYFDIKPLIEQKRKVEDERSKCLDVFNSTLKAHANVVFQQFDDLCNDLQALGDVHMVRPDSQHIELMYGDRILIKCTMYYTEKQLSDGTHCAYGVKRTYHLYTKQATLKRFDSFEELVESEDFKNVITKYL